MDNPIQELIEMFEGATAEVAATLYDEIEESFDNSEIHLLISRIHNVAPDYPSQGDIIQEIISKLRRIVIGRSF